MDTHIERPTLNAATVEENMAKVDTWIADTADKLNVALKTSKTQSTSTSKSGTSGYDKRYANATTAIYLGSECREVAKII